MKRYSPCLIASAQTIARLPHVRASGQNVGVAVSGVADSVVPAARAGRTRSALGPSVERSAPGPRAARRRNPARMPNSCVAWRLDWGWRLLAPRSLRRPIRPTQPGAGRAGGTPAGLLPRNHRHRRGGSAWPPGTPAPTRPRPSSSVFLRGSGTAGLAGIPARHIRGHCPALIEVERGEVRQFLLDRGIAWREDSTNASLQFARNRIRHELLPQIAREWKPGHRRNPGQHGGLALAEEAWWDAEIDRLSAQHFTATDDAVVLRADGLAALPLAVARRLVRRAMEVVKGDLRGIDFGHIAAVMDPRRKHGRARTATGAGARHLPFVRVAAFRPAARGWCGYPQLPPDAGRAGEGAGARTDLRHFFGTD